MGQYTNIHGQYTNIHGQYTKVMVWLHTIASLHRPGHAVGQYSLGQYNFIGQGTLWASIPIYMAIM